MLTALAMATQMQRLTPLRASALRDLHARAPAAGGGTRDVPENKNRKKATHGSRTAIKTLFFANRPCKRA